MGRAPSVIIIARHGARLDAEDKNWAEFAAAPYDPPLSYGGWTQTRALGARIASLLRERDMAMNDEEKNGRRRGPDTVGSDYFQGYDGQTPSSPSKPRNRKIVIHSSPFLRCIQSSIAISAGIAQYQGNLKRFENAHTKIDKRPSRTFTPPTRSHTVDTSVLEAKYTYSTAESRSHLRPKTADSDVEEGPWKPTLRIDAFLGEWLSPTYYELVTPPPPSYMMVAGAKADMIRPSTPILGSSIASRALPSPPPKARRASSTVTFDLPELAEALPKDEHVMVQKSEAVTSLRPRHKSISTGYAPPTPNYAISASESIPPGYVAHARESCVRLDYPWDSMSEPQNWGDGGEYGEEWAAMHTRFRRGLMEMISWYKTRSLYLDPQDKSIDWEDEIEEDDDLVVVLVTHSAGCNALIGAITNHPVLMDVGMGSLTMAVNKGSASGLPMPRKSSVSGRRRSSVDTSQSQDYEMKIIASMEHLRAGADPLRIPALQSPYLSAIPENGRRKDTLNSISDGTLTPELEHMAGKNTALGSILRNRSTTISSTHTIGSDSAGRSVSGLWGSRTQTMVDPYHTLPSRENSIDQGSSSQDEDQDEMPTPVALPTAVNKSNSQRGLWGGGPRKEPVRRWTVNEHKI